MTDVQPFYPRRILSSTTTGDLLDGISRSLAAGSKAILIDFEQVMFMDSTGLSALVITLKRVREANARLALCRLNGQALMVLEHSGMDKVFEIYDTPADFEQALANQSNELLTN